MSLCFSADKGQCSEVETAKPMLRASSSSVLRSEVRETFKRAPASERQSCYDSELDSTDYPGEVIYREPARQRTAPAAERGGAATGGGAGLSNGHIRSLLSTVKQRAQIEIWRSGSLVHCQREKEMMAVLPPKRGKVHGFSRKSRSRMIATQGKIRWNIECLPYFMGNTCPDNVPDADHVIHAWAKFNRRFERRFPQGALLWRKEIKDRKSGTCKGQWVPHYHSFAYNCARNFEFQEERGQWVTLRKGAVGGWTLKMYRLNKEGEKELFKTREYEPGTTDKLTDWWSRNWYEVMGTPGEFSHYMAGTSFEEIQTIEGVRFYTAKYMAKVEEAGESAHCKGRAGEVLWPVKIFRGLNG